MVVIVNNKCKQMYYVDDLERIKKGEGGRRRNMMQKHLMRHPPKHAQLEK